MNPIPLLATGILLSIASTAGQEAEPVHKAGNGVSVPVVLSDVKPRYTPEAMRERVAGLVKLEGIVETDGSVSDVRVVSPLHPGLDESAVEAFKQWRFKPGMKDGKPVRVQIDVEMTFTLRTPGPGLDSLDVFTPGPGVTAPVVLKEVKPEYTAKARDAGIQGTVTLECVVLSDGWVGDTRVTKGLDPDLDRQAVQTLRRWRFKPGERQGKPVPVRVQVEMNFTLK